jgi:uncharacterized protein YnzC (UPF0291/DUF896 family)
MLDQVLINRINELAKKSKDGGLTPQEKKEQQKLRELYLKSFRSQFKEHLKSVKVVDPEGNDVTPEKLKSLKEDNKNIQ